MKKIYFVVLPFMIISCSNQFPLIFLSYGNQDNTNIDITDKNIPNCKSGKYIDLYSGDIVKKISKTPEIEIIYSEDKTKKLCVISGEIKISRVKEH